MRALVVTLSVFIGCTGAGADTPLVDACKRAYGHWAMEKTPSLVEMVQDFSNLKPPRVRFKVSDGPISLTFSCTFKSPTAPLILTEFCTLVSCSKAGDPRFDEIFELLRREQRP